MSVPTAAVPTTHIERPITHCVLQMDARTETSANTGKLVVGVNLILRWRTEACVKVSKRNVQPHKARLHRRFFACCTTQCNFCRAEVANSCDFIAILV